MDKNDENGFFEPKFDENDHIDIHENSTKEFQRREFAPEELLDEITLSMVEGVGSLTTCALLERFGDAGAVLSAGQSELRIVPGLGPVLAQRISSARETLHPLGLIDMCNREGITILSIRDSRYPKQLLTIHDPPQLLYIKGSLLPEDVFSIAVVGTRRMSDYGRKMTERLSAQIVKAGFTLISGLALGIDGVAHRTALDNGGRTLAVLGSGLMNLYPPQHRGLFEAIPAQGAVLSEYHPLMSPNRGTFPQRNRIVSGLSLGVLVVEAPEKSGAMITARLAAEQGRELFAITGPADAYNSLGTNALIRDGAIMVGKIDDILESLGPMERSVNVKTSSEPLRHPAELTLNDIERQVLSHIADRNPVSIEELIERSRLEKNQVLAALWVLEERRILRRVTPNTVARL